MTANMEIHAGQRHHQQCRACEPGADGKVEHTCHSFQRNVSGNRTEEQRLTGNTSGQELEHANTGRCGEHNPQFGQPAEGIAGEGCQPVADTNHSGQQQYRGGIAEGTQFSTIEYDSENYRFPAGPGQPQFGWEAPRTESRMGFTVNGYNYREDLLRMAGNGVVW